MNIKLGNVDESGMESYPSVSLTGIKQKLPDSGTITFQYTKSEGEDGSVNLDLESITSCEDTGALEDSNLDDLKDESLGEMGEGADTDDTGEDADMDAEEGEGEDPFVDDAPVVPSKTKAKIPFNKGKFPFSK
jgi:hypothetical protein